MKPFQLTNEMHQEMVDGVKALADTDTHDAAGSGAMPPRLRRRAIDVLHSNGDAPQREDDQAMSGEEAIGASPPEDPINPSHYRRHPSGIECIEVARHLNFNVGNAIKYLWRYQDKGDPVNNLKKAQWYIDDEIRRLQGQR